MKPDTTDIIGVCNFTGVARGAFQACFLVMDKVDEYAVQTHSKGVELETSIDNLVAQSLYKKLGYIENTQYKRYFKKVSND